VAATYRGHDPNTPIAGSSSSSATNSTAINGTAVTIPADGDLVLWLGAYRNASASKTITPPSGMGNRNNGTARNGTSTIFDRILLADDGTTTAGITDSTETDGTISGSVDNGSQIIVLNLPIVQKGAPLLMSL
jgi:hypothetical protein